MWQCFGGQAADEGCSQGLWIGLQGNNKGISNITVEELQKVGLNDAFLPPLQQRMKSVDGMHHPPQPD
ncbi:hypothetical protein CHUAL_000053 [Chamberlinius hualienensis]